MQLKHINFATSDVAGLGAFFERYFAFKRLLERLRRIHADEQ